MSAEFEERNFDRNTTLLVAGAVGASALATVGLMTYALVKDSGATVKELYSDVWQGVHPVSDRVSNYYHAGSEVAARVAKFTKQEFKMLGSVVTSFTEGQPRRYG